LKHARERAWTMFQVLKQTMRAAICGRQESPDPSTVGTHFAGARRARTQQGMFRDFVVSSGGTGRDAAAPRLIALRNAKLEPNSACSWTVSICQQRLLLPSTRHLTTLKVSVVAISGDDQYPTCTYTSRCTNTVSSERNGQCKSVHKVFWCVLCKNSNALLSRD
jgi:hypothetical protein